MEPRLVPTEDTLDLQGAARLLKIHPITLQRKAKSGEIPAAKIGRAWVFVKVDLLEHIRAQYAPRMAQGDTKENQLCRSTYAKTRPYSGSKSRLTDGQYRKALGLPTD
jgi:excisionase family DNA binding protein